MLDEAILQAILGRLPRLSILVVGDFFLDRYLEIDHRLTEPSIETGQDAFQVTGVRASPGAGGTVTNNLSALGVGHISALTMIGVDGEGFELKRELTARRVDWSYAVETPHRRTPTYTKPMLSTEAGPARELNRLDIKNRRPLPDDCAAAIIERLEPAAAAADAVIVADQVSESECGVVTSAVRDRLAQWARQYPDKPIVADSRERIGLFRSVIVKPNRLECERAIRASSGVRVPSVETAARALATRVGRDVYCTCGEEGIVWVRGAEVTRVAAFPVTGPIDVVGAGDSTTAGIVCALCAGVDPIAAAAFGNLIASITIRQIGTTGTASPDQVVARWKECIRE